MQLIALKFQSLHLYHTGEQDEMNSQLVNRYIQEIFLFFFAILKIHLLSGTIISSFWKMLCKRSARTTAQLLKETVSYVA